MKKLALLDLDGTLADDRHRQHHAIASRWVEYFGAMDADEVWFEGRALVAGLVAQGYEIAYLTGRREDTRPKTEAWLVANNFPAGRVNMKPKLLPGQDREALRTAVFKAELIAKLLAEKPAREVVLYDDDPEVCRVVNEVNGAGTAVQCGWHVKPAEMVRRGEA